MFMFLNCRHSKGNPVGVAPQPAHTGLLVVALLFLVCAPSRAEGPAAQCFEKASSLFGLKSPKVLRVFAEQESGGRCQQRHPVNADGSYDIGCMGINSSWLPTLKSKFGITERDLYVPCTNIHVGAWIYARNIRQFGDNWRAAGAYNARSEHKRIEYAWKINARLAIAR